MKNDGNILRHIKKIKKKNDYEGDAFTLHDESQTLSFMKKMDMKGRVV